MEMCTWYHDTTVCKQQFSRNSMVARLMCSRLAQPCGRDAHATTNPCMRSTTILDWDADAWSQRLNAGISRTASCVNGRTLSRPPPKRYCLASYAAGSPNLVVVPLMHPPAHGCDQPPSVTGLRICMEPATERGQIAYSSLRRRPDTVQAGPHPMLDRPIRCRTARRRGRAADATAHPWMPSTTIRDGFADMHGASD